MRTQTSRITRLRGDTPRESVDLPNILKTLSAGMRVHKEQGGSQADTEEANEAPV